MKYFLTAILILISPLHASVDVEKSEVTYIDEIEAFPEDMVGRELYIECKNLTAVSVRGEPDYYQVDGRCKTMKDKNKYMGTNPYRVEFTGSKDIAKTIMYKVDHEMAVLLHGTIVKNKSRLRTSSYQFQIKMITTTGY